MHSDDVIIIGAGPAGCAAARVLGQRGWRVRLFDKAHFPREKTCGDALIHDAHLALDRLGLSERLAPLAYTSAALRLISFDGSQVSVRGRTACLPRVELDALLLTAAREAGAEFAPGHDFRALNADAAGYRVEFAAHGERVVATAPWVLLATGAAATPIGRAGLLERAAPSSFAVRQYVRNERLAAELDELVLIFDRTVRGGYGWVFPGPGAVFNVGIGYFGGAKHDSLRADYARFCEQVPLARELLRDGEVLTPLKGAPLRTGLTGTRFADGGLLAIGECAGTTFPLTGEGIGKALETGILGADTLLANGTAGPAAVAQAYTAAMRALQPKFAAYRRAELLLRWPWLANTLVARAAQGDYMRGRLEALYQERVDPARLFKLRTWLRILRG